MTPRVVITGAAAICPLGADWDTIADRLMAGVACAERLALPTQPVSTPVLVAAAPLPQSDPGGATRIQSLLDAAVVSLMADIKLPDLNLATVIGVGRTPTPLTSFDVARPGFGDRHGSYGHAARLSTTHRLTGPTYTCYTACSTGNDVLGLACRLIRRGVVEAALCGAADSQLNTASYIEFALLNALAPATNEAPQPRPFDHRRRGLVIGEGSAVFLLETLDRARRRGAHILAEIVGYASFSDCHSLTRGHPQASGARAALTGALADARLVPGDIDYINAHATGTPIGDELEVLAIKSVFGHNAYRLPISSTKSMHGHLLAAAGAVECALCIMCLQRQRLPPTINFERSDIDPLLDFVPNASRPATLTTVMSNALGFGGQNSSVILRRPSDLAQPA